MTFFLVKHKDIWPTLSVLATVTCLVKFLFEGVSFYFNGHQVLLGHVDSMTYGTILAPILGAHSFAHNRNINKKGNNECESDTK